MCVCGLHKTIGTHKLLFKVTDMTRRTDVVNKMKLKKTHTVKERIKMTEEEIIESVLGRLFNCKFESAYNNLKDIKSTRPEILKAFKEASDDFGNCGWGGDKISDTADKLAKLIGYRWDKEQEDYIKI